MKYFFKVELNIIADRCDIISEDICLDLQNQKIYVWIIKTDVIAFIGNIIMCLIS